MAHHHPGYAAQPRQYNAHPQTYTKPQSYDESTRYAERPSIVQRQNYYDLEPVQPSQNNGYVQPARGDHGAGEGYSEDRGYNENRAHRSPPAHFPMGDYQKPVKRPPMQPPPPRPIDTRNRVFQDRPAPRSAGPYQGSHGFYIQDEPHAPRQLQPQDNGSANPGYTGYAEESGYSDYDHGYIYEPGNKGQNGQPYRPNNAQKIQQHHRGHSDGLYKRSEEVLSSSHREFSQPRSNYERPNTRPNGGLDMQKRNIHEGAMSPEALSWDNPFPTFPAARRKGGQSENSLNGAMADMSLRGGAGKIGDGRPGTASGRSNIDNSRSVGGMQSTRSEFSPIPDGNIPRNEAKIKGGNQRQEVYDDQQTSLEAHGASRYDTARNGARTPMEKSPQNLRRPDPPIGRRSDEPPRAMLLQQYASFEPDAGRSRTMPSSFSDAVINPQTQKGYRQPPAWQDSQGMVGNFRPGTRSYQQSEGPSTASGARPAGAGEIRSGEIARLMSEQARSPLGKGGKNFQQKALRPPAVHQDNIADLYDSYHDMSSPKQPNHAYQADRNDQSPFEEEMPNFDPVPLPSPGHQRGMTIDDHMSPPPQSPKMPPMPAQYREGDPATFSPRTRSRQVMHSKSQPDLGNRRAPRTQQDNGFDFGIPEATPGMPQFDHITSQTPAHFGRDRQNYDGRQGPAGNNRRQPPAPYRSNGDPQLNDPYPQSGAGARPYKPSPQPYQNQPPSERYRADVEANSVNSHGRRQPDQAQPDRYHSPNGHDRASSDRPIPAAAGGPTSPPSGKPDALPAHPAPVRAGLMQSSSPTQPPKPVPIRNYNNNASPLQEPIVTQPPLSTQPSNNQSSAPKFTSGDLEKLRIAAKSSSSDQKAQMNLAKALVQAANALEEYVPQTDQKARNKTRERHVSEAHKTIKRLVSTGYPDAMFFLGDCYSQGRLGLDQDSKEAFGLYQGAAKAGHAQAAFRVAVCCELGLEEDGGTRRDLGKAVQWYKRAATLGDTPAMYKTGVILLKGLLGQPKDPGEAVAWLRKAAEKADKDNPHALHELAMWHEAASGSGRTAGDEAYAKQLFVQAAELGYKFSQYRLGRACEYGLMGCPIDPRLSISWYSKAAVQEEHQSELALSGWYLTGAEGVLQQSDTEAYLWARKAATAGLAKAEFAMGYFTEVGIGCPPSSEEAKRWYWRAASQNFPKARERLEELRKGGAKMKKERVSRSAMKQESECSIM